MLLLFSKLLGLPFVKLEQKLRASTALLDLRDNGSALGFEDAL